MAKAKPDKNRKLTPQQELFCRFYTQNEALFGNATLSYAEAYRFELDTLSTERPCEAAADEKHKHTRDCPDSPYDIASDMRGERIEIA